MDDHIYWKKRQQRTMKNSILSLWGRTFRNRVSYYIFLLFIWRSPSHSQSILDNITKNKWYITIFILCLYINSIFSQQQEYEVVVGGSTIVTASEYGSNDDNDHDEHWCNSISMSRWMLQQLPPIEHSPTPQNSPQNSLMHSNPHHW